MFTSLKIREFRIFWVAMSVSLMGTWVQGIAQSWLVYQLTGSVFLLGLVGFLSFLPLSLFSLPSGALVDRMVKRNILLGTQIAFTLLAFLLAYLVGTGAVRVWHIVLIAFCNGLVLTLDAPARQAMVVDLVGKQHLLNAIALNSAAFNSARFVGPALGGILIAAVGLRGCFYINAISFLPVIAALLFIRPRPVGTMSAKKSFWSDTLATFSVIKQNPFLLGLFALVGVVSLFGTAYVVLMPVYAKEIFHSDSRALAILMSANGLGALIGALN
ncbi:MAG: MFS transporter, partial [Candidatus Omnitrophota bacterium]